ARITVTLSYRDMQCGQNGPMSREAGACSHDLTSSFGLCHFCSRMKQTVSDSCAETKHSSSNLMRAVESAFRVLELLHQSADGRHVSELARELELPKATVFRILFTLQHLGYARKDSATRTYHSRREMGWFTRD